MILSMHQIFSTESFMYNRSSRLPTGSTLLWQRMRDSVQLYVQPELSNKAIYHFNRFSKEYK